jgi:hypothetical protein
MSVAIAIYQQIYCRYLAPGEAIIHDRGPEFANEVSRILHEEFGVKIKIISTGRPQGNGQAEAMVKSLKQKMLCLMSEEHDSLPDIWDQTLLHMSLQILRSDPACAHGYAPGEIALGRSLVYPCELERDDIDFEGATLTEPLVEALTQIHEESFGKACEKITAYQKKYKRDYDERHKVKDFNLKEGSKVQILRTKTKKAKGGKTEIKWRPRNSFYTLRKICKRKKTVLVFNPKTGKNLKKSYPFDRVRQFKGN